MSAKKKLVFAEYSTVGFDSEAWLLRRAPPTLSGSLALANGCLAFADRDGDVHFATPVDEIEQIWSPWQYFQGGLKIRANGQMYRISFAHPRDQDGSDRRDDQTTRSALRRSDDVARGRELTRIWKTALELAATT